MAFRLFRMRQERKRAERDRSKLDDVRVEGVTSVVIVGDEASEPARDAARAAAFKALRLIVAEGVIWQDAAEDLLVEIRERRPLAELAPRGGELMNRFVALNRRLPESNDPDITRHTSVLHSVFDHHALMLSSSLDLLSVDWRSERMLEQLDQIDGLGAPAQWLEAIRAELALPDVPRG